jgi:tetratricopeptide (TPR) repeat protein
MGRANEAEAHINEAFRLSPRDTYSYRWMTIIGFAKLWDDAFADAVVWLRRGIEANPNSTIAYFLLAATLALLDKLDEARAIAQAGLAINPTFTIRRFRTLRSSDSSYRAKRERIYEGMRMAGIPDG